MAKVAIKLSALSLLLVLAVGTAWSMVGDQMTRQTTLIFFILVIISRFDMLNLN